MSYSLGLDASTQSFSAIVIDIENGSVVAESSIQFGSALPEYGAPSGFITGGKNGEVHSDPLMWVAAMELLLAELASKCDLSKVKAVSGAGQQHGSVYLNNQWTESLANLSADSPLTGQLKGCLSRVTSPIWMDSSTSVECAEIADAVGGDEVICAKSGSIATERFTGPQIRKFAKLDTDGYAATERIHLVSSFICSLLIGADAPLDTGDGAGMNLLNISSWEWDDALLDATAAGLKAKLPSVVAGDKVVGTVAGYFVEKYGFSEGVEVTVFTGDNPSSLVGMGASLPGKVVVSLGTSDTFFAALPEGANGVSDDAGCGHVFGNAAVAGGAMSLQCFVNGSLARESVRDRFDYDWDAFTAAFKNTAVGNDGNLMIPFFDPETSPKIALEKPILKGSDSFEAWNDGDAAVRGCVEGQFMNMKLRTGWMGLKPEVIYVTGGASKNDGVVQVLANVFGVKVQRLEVSGSVGLGAAMRAACSTLGQDLAELEDRFSQPDLTSTIEPQVEAGCYAELSEAWQKLL